jgi:hypothetical protein
MATGKLLMALIHPPNATEWQIGDLVIHDADAKRADMLMIVTGRSRNGIVRTGYLFPETMSRDWRRKVWRNTIDSLHDPQRFGIATQNLSVIARGAIARETSAAVRRSATPSPTAFPIAKS